MVAVSVSATVSVADGPLLPVNTKLSADSYSVANVTLGPAGSGTETEEIPLLPGAGTVTLLAVRATSGSAPAAVTVTPTNGATDGDPIDVAGVLLVANAGVLEALVAGGPRTVTITNVAAAATVVDVIACLDS
jgi:hypothetical protein